LLVNGNIDEITFNTTTPTIKNVFTYSQNQSNAVWLKSATTVVSNAAIAPDGTLTASKLIGNNGASDRKSTYQTASITANTYYTYSVYLKAAEYDSATIWIDTVGTLPNAYQGANSLANLTLGTVGGAQTSMTPVGNGWYRCSTTGSANISSVNFTISQGDANGVGTPAGNGSSGIYIWGAQLELGNIATTYQGIAAASTLVTPNFATKTVSDTVFATGQFDEITYNITTPTIKNLAVYSQNPSGAGWTGYGRSWTTNYDYAPDGTRTAARIVENADITAALHGGGQGQTTYVAGNRYTISMYLKSYSADRNLMYGVSSSVIGGTASDYVYADCNPDTGVVGNAIVYAPAAQTTSVTNVGNGWYRFSLSFLAANTATSGVDMQLRGTGTRAIQTYIGNGTSGMLFWGLQIEQSSSPTIYQGVTTANTLITPTFATRSDNTGVVYATNTFDEVTGAPVVDTGLSLWLDAAQTTSGGGTTWTDISGSGYNFFGQSGGGSAPTFNNIPGSYNINNTTLLGFNTSTGTLPKLDTDTFSVEAWVLHTSFNAGGEYNNMIGNRENFGISGFRFGVLTPSNLSTDTTGRPRLWTNQSGGTIITTGSNYPISLNTWYQVTVTYEGNNCLLYINRALYASTTGKYVAPVGRFAYIGTNAIGCQSLNGQISAFKWYNRSLTADEVAQNFNALRRRYGI
jgi:hypothetical protein